MIIPLTILFIAALVALVALIRFIVRKIRHRNDPKTPSNLGRDFQKFANKTKWKRWGLTTALVLVVMSAAYVVFTQINSDWMSKEYNKTNNLAVDYLDTQAPNISNNNMFINNYGTFSSNLHLDTYKDIDGYRVSWQPFDFGFGTFKSAPQTGYYQFASPVQDGNAYYTQGTNQKIATFFLPKINYKSKNYFGLQPTHDAGKIATMPNQLAEVAVSFDKPYSYADIQKMIPKNLLINWYWIGAYDDNNIDFGQQANYFGINASSKASNNGATSILDGTLDSAEYNNFVHSLKDWVKAGNSYTINSFKVEQDALQQVKKYPTLTTAKFSGVILTGRTKNFTQLDKENWVFATNVGLTTEIRPDLTPIK